MSKMKIEVKMTNKNKITGMRKLPDKKGKCRNCYYYISKRFKSFQQKKKDTNEDTVPVARTPEIVLKDYCCCHHKSGEEARQICTGCWIYEQE
jgi:hypothetical protein